MPNYRFKMRKILSLAITVLSMHVVHAQTPVGAWSDYFSYNTAKGVAAGVKQVYASTGASLLIYNKEFAELKKMTKTSGLSETGISAISWSEEYNTLIIGYLNTNVDLLINNTIFNIPEILNKYLTGAKEIHRIRTSGKYAFLACSFGIVVIDLSRKEIYDTWKPGADPDDNPVWDITTGNDTIYAATESGIFRARLSDQGLSYFANWTRISSPPDPGGKYTSIIFSSGRIFASKSDPLADGDSLFSIGTSASLFSYGSGIFIKSIDPGTGGFTVSDGSSAKYYNPGGILIKSISGYGFAASNVLQSVADNGNIWIADKNSGLVKGEGMNNFSVLKPAGPASDNAFHITSSDGRATVCAGGTDNSWNAAGRPFQVSLFHDNTWTYISDVQSRDAVRSFTDPADAGHIFISSWGSGLFEYKDGSLLHHYTDVNSPLQSIVPGKDYIRILGLAMDKSKNLWITQSGVAGSIKVLRPDGGWIVNPVTIDVPVTGDLVITRSGYKWILLPGGHGLFILDDHKTPSDFTDDRYKQITVRDADNRIITNVYSLAEDLDGNIWTGTDEGPLVYYTPEKVFDQDLKASRIKVSRNDGSGLSDYLLRTETITSLSVDGANRKWLGTSGSGVYLVSPDGTRQVLSFNEKNSPLLSDSIISLAVDNKSGDIWFGTSKGLQSYRGNTTAGSEKFTNVYAFPNPVREDFNGNVTITGLMMNTQINITDISGNLVYKTFSDGGQATWDLKTYNGKRVATGVYLIFCASSEGTEAFVTKILVIR